MQFPAPSPLASMLCTERTPAVPSVPYSLFPIPIPYFLFPVPCPLPSICNICSIFRKRETPDRLQMDFVIKVRAILLQANSRTYVQNWEGVGGNEIMYGRVPDPPLRKDDFAAEWFFCGRAFNILYDCLPPQRWHMLLLAEGDKYCSLRSQHHGPLRTNDPLFFNLSFRTK